MLKVNVFTVFVEKEILALPSNDTPLIVIGTASLVAVAALPKIFPITFEPLIVAILASVTFESRIFIVVIALLELKIIIICLLSIVTFNLKIKLHQNLFYGIWIFS